MYDESVRLLRYVVLELALVVAGLAALGLVVVKGTAAISRRVDASHRDKLSSLYPVRGAPTTAPEPQVTGDGGGTFLGMSDDLLLARLRSAPIKRAKLNRGGSSLSFRFDLADGSRAAWKPAQTNLQTIPRKEVAAYRVSRLLGLNGVPPAVQRAVTREELYRHLHPESQPFLPRIRAETLFNPQGTSIGTAMYWIPEIRDAGLDTAEGIQRSTAWVKIGTEIPEAERGLAAQFSDLVVFDFLIANPDRYSGGNIKMSPEGDRLYFMDNTMAFFLMPEGHAKNRSWLDRTQRYSARLVRALARVTEPTLQRLLGPDIDGQDILTLSEIRAVIARREFVQRHVSSLVALHGEANVLVFP